MSENSLFATVCIALYPTLNKYVLIVAQGHILITLDYMLFERMDNLCPSGGMFLRSTQKAPQEQSIVTNSRKRNWFKWTQDMPDRGLTKGDG